MSRPLTILGIDGSNSVVFTFHPDEPGKELALDETELATLMQAIQGDYLALWPAEECGRDGCTNPAVATIEGKPFCEADALGWTIREMESGRWGK